MTTEKDFKVIIVGGGVAGLALANMLEEYGLDYLILESHSAIAPQVGASIGMFPNGLRILDQIGLYDPIRAQFEGQALCETSYTRSANGKAIETMNGFLTHLERSHGYPLLFFDRQQLLKVLYDHLRHKERVLVNKRVTEIDLGLRAASVKCTDGSVFEGTLVIGADGVHSTVRDSMTALANKLEPGYFDPAEASKVPCFYRCSFGIAKDVPGWIYGAQHIVVGKNKSQLVVSGPEGKVYWFLFERLPEPKYGKDIPKYSRDDEAEFVRKHRGVPVTETITFGQIYDSKLTSTLTPLHEVVYDKWFYQRIMTIGDSAHKPNPIGGQGANGAIESCAELINALVRMKTKRGGSLAGLSTEEVIQISAEVQEARHDRATLIVSNSNQSQALFAYENPLLSSAILEWIAPFAGSESTLNRMGSVLLGATRIKTLPVPLRKRLIPFDDELQSVPALNKTSTIVRGALIGAMGLALLATAKTWRIPFNSRHGSLAANATTVFNKIAEAPILSLPGQGTSANLGTIYQLTQIISPLLIYAVEGYRVGHQGTPLAMPLIFSAALGFRGLGLAVPLHAALSSIFTHKGSGGRAVPLGVAGALVPALTLGYILPSILAVLPPSDAEGLSLWRFGPSLFNLLTYLFAFGFKRWEQRGKAVSEAQSRIDVDRYTNHDVQALKSTYSYVFGIQATAHLVALVFAWKSPATSVNATHLVPSSTIPAVARKLAPLFGYDLVAGFAGIVASNLYSVWDLRRLGYIKTRDAIRVAAGVIAGQFIAGPGATWAGLWYWRESILARKPSPNK